jgi:rare lipoprotein A
LKFLIICLGMFLGSVSVSQAYQCKASVYGTSKKEHLSKHTASGDIFDRSKLTVAMRTHHFHQHFRITNPATHLSVVVENNDLGPFVKGRCVDLNPAVARALRFHGVQTVDIAKL